MSSSGRAPTPLLEKMRAAGDVGIMGGRGDNGDVVVRESHDASPGGVKGRQYRRPHGRRRRRQEFSEKGCVWDTLVSAVRCASIATYHGVNPFCGLA